MKPSFLRAGVLIGISALFYSCDRITPLPKSPPTVAASVPNRDELYVFPFGRLSMTAFEVLRAEFKGVLPRDVAQIAMVTQWLMTRSAPKSRTTIAETARRVRVIFPPPVDVHVQSSAESFFREHFGISPLTQVRRVALDALSGWHVEWNPELVREYGISAEKPK